MITPLELVFIHHRAQVAELAYAVAEPGVTDSQKDLLWLSLLCTHFGTIHEPSTDTHVSIGYDRNAVYVTIRGTKSITNMMQDAKFRMTDWKGHLVHAGFARDYDGVAERVQIAVRSAIKIVVADTGKAPVVLFIGHSMGGAEVTLAAYDFQQYMNGGTRSITYTFGSPRVGSLRFAEAYNTLVGNITTYRVVHKNDPVPTMPLGIYHHVTGEVHLADDGRILGPVRSWWKELLGIGQEVAQTLILEDVPEHAMASYLAVTAAASKQYPFSFTSQSADASEVQ